MKNNKKLFTIFSIIVTCFAGLAIMFVFLPSIAGSGVIGTYLPLQEVENPVFSCFTLKANNVVTLTYSENGKSAQFTWYAKCDGISTSIYFVLSETSERQFNLLQNRELKDLYHNGDLYYKK